MTVLPSSGIEPVTSSVRIGSCPAANATLARSVRFAPRRPTVGRGVAPVGRSPYGLDHHASCDHPERAQPGDLEDLLRVPDDVPEIRDGGGDTDGNQQPEHPAEVALISGRGEMGTSGGTAGSISYRIRDATGREGQERGVRRAEAPKPGLDAASCASCSGVRCAGPVSASARASVCSISVCVSRRSASMDAWNSVSRPRTAESGDQLVGRAFAMAAACPGWRPLR